MGGLLPLPALEDEQHMLLDCPQIDDSHNTHGEMLQWPSLD